MSDSLFWKTYDNNRQWHFKKMLLKPLLLEFYNFWESEQELKDIKGQMASLKETESVEITSVGYALCSNITSERNTHNSKAAMLLEQKACQPKYDHKRKQKRYLWKRNFD